MSKLIKIVAICITLNNILIIESRYANTIRNKGNDYYINNSVKNDTSSTTADDSNHNIINSIPILNDISLIYKIYHQCSMDPRNIIVCLKIKLFSSLDKATRYDKDINFTEDIKFIKDKSADSGNRKEQNKEEDLKNNIIENLPRGLDEKESTLNGLILEKAISFLQNRKIQIVFPDSWNKNDSFEGRKKKDKKGQGAFIMIPLLLGGTFVPIAYGALALLAGKALIVSKLALVLASIIGIKKLLSGGGNKDSSHEVVVSGGHSNSGWGRDLDLAYNGYNTDIQKKQIS